MSTAAPIHFATIGSTNAWLAETAAGHPDETWVLADTQTAGRGRHGRRWTSLPGNLFTSVLARLQPGEGPPQQLSFVAALALADALTPWLGRMRLSLKWPNDLLLSGAKLAGILLEATPAGTVIGFGVNLAHEPAGIEGRVAALAQTGREPPTPAILRTELARCFTAERARWRAHGFAPIRTAWLARATPVGWRTSVRQGETLISGTFAGMADDGALLLLRDGRIETIHAGEVIA